MSMTLILWKAPVVDDPDEAQKLLSAWYETGDEGAFEASEDIARLASELRSRWPDEYESDPPQDCPWADMPLTQSERLLAIDIRLRKGVRHNLLLDLRKLSQTPAVIIAGFVAAGLFVVGAMIAGVLGLVDVNEGRAACGRDESPR